jgi:nicotinamidase-related amidase
VRSLRARLTVGVGLVIAVVLGVSGVLISHYADRTAREALDDRLRRTAELSRATAVDAVQHGFPVLVPRECVADRAREPHEASLFDLQAKYADVVPVDDVTAYLTATSQGAPVPVDA